MNITSDNYEQFKAQYKLAVAHKLVTFNFFGQDILTSYAKYVCAYVDTDRRSVDSVSECECTWCGEVQPCVHGVCQECAYQLEVAKN